MIVNGNSTELIPVTITDPLEEELPRLGLLNLQDLETGELVKAGVEGRALAERLEQEGITLLAGMDAILVPGGFGERGVEGKIEAVRYARENNIPYLGICLGMQVAVIEYARNVAGLAGAHSTEFDKGAAHPVIALIEEWQRADGGHELRSEESDLGGTMRLGGQQCQLAEGSLARQIYGRELIEERHRHRYEFNNDFLEDFRKNGMIPTGINPESGLVEIMEQTDHPWFVGTQFHPEYRSTVLNPHPLFISFIKAVADNKK